MSSSVRDYEKLAVDIIDTVGGKNNISKVSRCATRLRLVLKETPANAKEAVSALTGGHHCCGKQWTIPSRHWNARRKSF